MFEILIRGVVQGVGFRPFVFNLARESNIKGYVQNIGDGVKILCDDADFSEKLKNNLPSLAKISKIVIHASDEVYKGDDFEIKNSVNVSSYSSIPADLNLCEHCIRELFDKEDFRYKYFFVSCTNCGPRFSIANGMPYDRDKTSLKDFDLCKTCKAEYENPANRRYHAQTVACSRCGPRLNLYIAGELFEGDIIAKICELLCSGELVAIKGVGGFYLCCKADSVMKLRELTKRSHKPFALMAKDLDMIERCCFVNDKEKEVLLSKERPIVLLSKKIKTDFLKVSELSTLGFMLPYSGVHYLIFEKINFPMIMTSSNMPNHPITTKKEEQFVKYVLDYDREIVNFVDDSILKLINDYPLIIRRSRGFVPNEILLKGVYATMGSVIAVGAEMKNVFCVKKDEKLIASQHIGNTFNVDNFENFKLSVYRFLDFTKTSPQAVLCDMNSVFNTSVFAKELARKKNLDVVEVQHHIAHGFSVAIEHNLNDFIAIVCDGTGLGLDGNVWGGEVFHNDKRIGRLEYQSLIGGDIANKEPKRILAGALSEFLSIDEVSSYLGDEATTWIRQRQEGFNCIDSSSAGRIFDVASVLLGFCDENFYEGRGAMLLEGNSKKCKMFFEPQISKAEDGLLVLKTTPLIKFLYENVGNVDRENLAYFTQEYIAQGLFMIAQMYDGKVPICFGGGCAYNRVMTEFMMKNGVLLNKEIPCGDAGISCGQIGYYIWKRNKEL